MKTSNKDNLLFQCGYDNVNLAEILNVSEEEALNKLPYWIILPRLTRAQLLLLMVDLKLQLPTNFSRTRKSLCDLLLLKYSEWEEVLETKKNDTLDLLQFLIIFKPPALILAN